MSQDFDQQAARRFRDFCAGLIESGSLRPEELLEAKQAVLGKRDDITPGKVSSEEALEGLINMSMGDIDTLKRRLPLDPLTLARHEIAEKGRAEDETPPSATGRIIGGVAGSHIGRVLKSKIEQQGRSRAGGKKPLQEPND